MTIEAMIKGGKELHIIWAPPAKAFLAELWEKPSGDDKVPRMVKPFGLGRTVEEAINDLVWATNREAQ